MFDSHKWIKDFKASHAIQNRKSVISEDVATQFDQDMARFADELGDEIEDELENMPEDVRESLMREAIDPVSIVGYILLSNTVVSMLSKWASKTARKYGQINAADRSQQIYDFAHKNEQAFMAPIKRIVGIFIKDKKLLGKVTYVLYALVIFMMAGAAGGSALEALKKSAYFESALLTLKSAIKGKEVSTLIKQVLS